MSLFHPKLILFVIPSLKNDLQKLANLLEFEWGDQHDANEFFEKLLQKLNIEIEYLLIITKMKTNKIINNKQK